jgi:hypothetical protein
VISARHPCMNEDGTEKISFPSKREANTKISQIAFGKGKNKPDRPNASYRCKECGEYHLYNRKKDKAKRQARRKGVQIAT